MNVLILKLNAAGDVVRTTTLLRRLTGHVSWVTARMNVELLTGLPGVRPVSWEEREAVKDRRYDLLVNLEDEASTAAFAAGLDCTRVFGAYLNERGGVSYTEDARVWFDMSLISVYGRAHADGLKLRNRRTYQDLLFEGLGWRFQGERYMVSAPASSPLSGDVAIAPGAGPVWPMKGWAYYDQLERALEAAGLRVNVLPRRPSILEHMGDVANHRCLVGGDSLPMHLALATRTPCVTIFNCTSPQEIYGYGLQTKVVSPLLARFFYNRGEDPAATSAIPLETIYDAVMRTLLDSRSTPLQPGVSKEFLLSGT
jgi:ADP-heptose:LPS heptosyltransferase